MQIRSIRTRIMLWYVAILGVILLLLAGATYLVMSRMLAERLDDTLDNRAFLTLQLITLDADGRPDLALPENDPNLDDIFQRVFDAEGELVFDSSGAFGESPVDEETVERALRGDEVRTTVGSGDQRARILTVPIGGGGAIVGALQVANTTSDDDETLRSLLLVFAFAVPAALVLATAGGWWLSTRALAPIDRITRAAQEISEHDLSRRLGLDGMPDDEVGRLARTFDGMIARLEEAFERQRQFTADASHELRTPLTAMRGQIDVALQQARDPGAYQQVLTTLTGQVERMSRLVEGMLTLARADARQQPVVRERVDIAELAESVVAEMRPLAEGKGLSLVTEGSGAATVAGDGDLLLQLLVNLTDNAIKYTASGGVTIAWRETASGVEVDVRDTGEGITPEDQTRVFERFYRADPSRAADRGGVGLGLAICRWIAEAHGGTLTLESGPGGSTFRLRLPAASMPSSAS